MYGAKKNGLIAAGVIIVAICVIALIRMKMLLGYMVPCVAVVAFAVAVFLILFRDFFYVYMKRSIAAVGLLSLVAVISMAALLHSKGESKFDWASAGTLLILFTALMTVTGFLITITRLDEYHIRISTYDEFLMHLERFLAAASHMGNGSLKPLERLEKYVLKCWHKRQDNDEGVKILCSVPTLGNISHYSFFYRYVRRRWEQLATSGVSVDMVCVHPDVKRDGIPKLPLSGANPSYDLSNFKDDTANFGQWKALLTASSIGKFYNEEFVEKRQYEVPAVLRGVALAMEVIYWVKQGKAGAPENQVNGYQWPYDHDDLPPMHLFLTHDSALVAFPLDRGVKSTSSSDPIELLGYATTEPRIIRRLYSVFEEWKTQLEHTAIK